MEPKSNAMIDKSNLQTTNFTFTAPSSSSSSSKPESPFEKLALHPNVGMSDVQLDNELIPLLRNQQTTDVLNLENEIVRRLSEHMTTKGSLGIRAPSSNHPLGGLPGFRNQQERTERDKYEDVLRECEQIRVEHDLRWERAKPKK